RDEDHLRQEPEGHGDRELLERTRAPEERPGHGKAVLRVTATTGSRKRGTEGALRASRFAPRTRPSRLPSVARRPEDGFPLPACAPQPDGRRSACRCAFRPITPAREARRLLQRADL